MRELILNKKTGFRVKDSGKPVIIRDETGQSFYNTEPILPRVIAFNLPKGKYWIEKGHFERLESPLNYPLFKLPQFERYGFPDAKKFKIVFGENPNKCSILWDKKIILFDNSLKYYTKPMFDFIRFHEYAHRHYKTEKFCDLMAVNYMLFKGYNPSQIGETPVLSLSDNAYDRKVWLVNKILSYEQKRK